ncbi:MAG: hypothetical protein JSV81_07090 [Anaerolineales bacterium]|nr:MAG: hypothetical protein JSV81_07090 [Anaerolineales bacterium]
MKSGLKRIVVVGAVALAGILLVALLAGTALAQGPGPGMGWGGQGPGMMGGWQGMGRGVGWGGHGPGMMGGWQGMGRGMGGWGYGLAPTTGITDTLPFGSTACPGMGAYGYTTPAQGERLTLDQAAQAVEEYLSAYGNPDLAMAEVMEFTDNFYAEVEEQSTGIHAFELLIQPYTGVIHPEPGPNMMWNTKYGHMGGMWGSATQQPTADMKVGAAQAVENAQEYLDDYLPGTTVSDEADGFYGYYTLHVLQDGQVVGMLSVNGFSGQVWYHNWHGEFIGMTEGHE